MIEREILQALQTATTSAVINSIKPDFPVMYIDAAFTKPDDGQYLELLHIPNNPTAQYWGNEKKYQGLFRLILHWPVSGAGAYAPMDLLASISDYFRKNLWLNSRVKITQMPDLTGTAIKDRESGALLYMASLQYAAFEAA